MGYKERQEARILFQNKEAMAEKAIDLITDYFGPYASTGKSKDMGKLIDEFKEPLGDSRFYEILKKNGETLDKDPGDGLKRGALITAQLVSNLAESSIDAIENPNLELKEVRHQMFLAADFMRDSYKPMMIYVAHMLSGDELDGIAKTAISDKLPGTYKNATDVIYAVEAVGKAWNMIDNKVVEGLTIDDIKEFQSFTKEDIIKLMRYDIGLDDTKPEGYDLYVKIKKVADLIEKRRSDVDRVQSNIDVVYRQSNTKKIEFAKGAYIDVEQLNFALGDDFTSSKKDIKLMILDLDGRLTPETKYLVEHSENPDEKRLEEEAMKSVTNLLYGLGIGEKEEIEEAIKEKKWDKLKQMMSDEQYVVVFRSEGNLGRYTEGILSHLQSNLSIVRATDKVNLEFLSNATGAKIIKSLNSMEYKVAQTVDVEREYLDSQGLNGNASDYLFFGKKLSAEEIKAEASGKFEPHKAYTIIVNGPKSEMEETIHVIKNDMVPMALTNAQSRIPVEGEQQYYFVALGAGNIETRLSYIGETIAEKVYREKVERDLIEERFKLDWPRLSEKIKDIRDKYSDLSDKEIYMIYLKASGKDAMLKDLAKTAENFAKDVAESYMVVPQKLCRDNDVLVEDLKTRISEGFITQGIGYGYLVDSVENNIFHPILAYFRITDHAVDSATGYMPYRGV